MLSLGALAFSLVGIMVLGQEPASAPQRGHSLTPSSQPYGGVLAHPGAAHQVPVPGGCTG